jgi:hypothetical protein
MKPVGFTTPTKDADDYFKGGGTLEKFAALWRNATRPTVSYETIKETIDDLRNQTANKEQRRPEFEVNRLVAETVWEDLTGRGQFFQSGGLGMIFLTGSKKLIDITKGGHDLANLMIRYGLHPTDRMTRHVGEFLGAQAAEHGKAVEPHLFTHYDRERDTVYLSEYDGNVLRITPERIEQVPNGTDGVLFKTPENCQPFQIDLGKLPPVSSGIRLAQDSLVAKYITQQVRWDEENLSAEQYQTLFTAQMLTLFMPGVIRTKPLALLTGPSGSGKTMLAERVGWLLLGPKFNPVEMPENKDAFEALVTGSPFAVIDNVHNLKRSNAHQSLLMIAATGGAVTKRELYSTNKQVTFPVQAVLYLSAIHSPFRGDEVANRLLIYRTLKLESYRDSAAIKDEFMANREAILAEVVVRIQKVLTALRATKRLPVSTYFRMADFAAYLLKVAHHEKWGREAQALLLAVSQSQSDYGVEDEVVIEQFSLWINSCPEARTRSWSSSELDKALRDPRLNGGKLPWNEGDAKAMSTYVRNHQETFAKIFGMQVEKDRHLKMKRYRFSPAPEKLQALQEEASRRRADSPVLSPEELMRVLNKDNRPVV